MFNKTTEDRSRVSGGGTKVSVLSSDLEITGTVTSAGSIEISGHVKGEVEAATVTLGGDGEILGKLRAGAADVMGRIEGEIAADTLTLRSSAQARIVSISQILVIESGASVEGRFNKPAPAKAKAEPAPAPPPPAQPPEGGIE